MSNLPVFPDIPSTLPTPQERPVPDTTRDELEAAQAAWAAAHEAIMAAWKVTPSYLLRTRAPIPRDQFNQGIASITVIAMLNGCSGKLHDLKVNARHREQGYDWAVATDAEVVNREDQ